MLPLCSIVASKKFLDSRAKTLIGDSFGYLDKENVIKWNLKNVLTYGILADPVMYYILPRVNNSGGESV